MKLRARVSVTAMAAAAVLLVGPFTPAGAAPVRTTPVRTTPVSAAPVSAAAAAAAVGAGMFTTVSPARLLDTRAGTGAAKVAVAAHGTVAFGVLAHAGVPSSGVAAVVLTVTVDRPGAAGFVTAYATGTSRPGTSNVNFHAAQTVANLVVVPPGSGGRVSLYNGSTGSVELIADVSGYVMAGSSSSAGSFDAVSPARLLDTRSGIATPVAPGSSVIVPVDGHAGIPASGVSTVVVDVTATGSAAAGFLSAYADGETPGPTSTVNFTAGAAASNLAFVPVGADGEIAVRNGGTQPVQVVVDGFGYIRAGVANSPAATTPGAFDPVDLARVLDTRSGIGVAKMAVPAHHPFSVPVSGIDGVPAHDVAAVVLNVTVTRPTAVGYITSYATRTARPGTSSVDFTPGTTVASLAIVPVGSDGRAAFYNGSDGTVELVADLAGYLVAPRPTLEAAPFTSALDADDVSCASASLCVAVGQTGSSIARWSSYDGTRWTAPAALPALVAPLDVACPNVTYCLATDGVHSQTFDGTTWSAVSSLPGGFEVGPPDYVSENPRFACVSSTFCLLAGDEDAARWNGTSWAETAAFPTGDDAFELSCGTAMCMTIGDGAALVYDGATWTQAPRPPIRTGFDSAAKISCASSWCMVVGELTDGSGPGSSTFDGSTWSSPIEVPETATLSSLSCASTSWCMSVGQPAYVNSGTTSYSLYNGSSWSTAAQASTVGVLGGGGPVSCPSATFCAMVEAEGAVRTYDGHAWTSTSGLPGVPVAVSCAAATSCLAVNQFADALAWNGTRWTATPHAAGMGDFSQVSCPTATRCVAVGVDSANQGAATTWNGSAWSPPVALSMAEVVDVSCAATSFCVAIGTDRIPGDTENPFRPFRVARLDGSTWSTSELDSGKVLAPQSVSCTTSTFCAAVGYGVSEAADPLPLTFDGSAWNVFTPAFDDAFVGPVSCAPASTTCLIPRFDGTMLIHTGTGTSWSVAFGPALGGSDEVGDLSCVTATDCTASGRRNGSAVVWTYDGRGWSTPLTAPTTDGDAVSSISCVTGSFCAYVAGA